MITLKRKTKTEQNNGITMFNTSNEGTGGLGISYSSSSMFEFYGIFLATFNHCILCHMQISYLMIKSSASITVIGSCTVNIQIQIQSVDC